MIISMILSIPYCISCGPCNNKAMIWSWRVGFNSGRYHKCYCSLPCLADVIRYTFQMQMSILPLPEETTFIKGYYGLEACYIRGVVRIHFQQSLWIHSLILCAKGLTTTQFSDTEISTAARTKLLFKEQVLLLEDIKLDLQKYLDIPFEIQLPLFEPISQGFGPCSEV